MNRAILIPLLLTSMFTFAQQESNVRSQFERVVPKEMRSSFCSTLQTGVAAQRRKDWRSLYAIVLPQHRGKSIDDFARAEQERDLTILDFRIDRIDVEIEADASRKNGMWDVFGCALVNEKGKRVPMESAATVYLENDSWYIDMIEILMKIDSPAPPHKCILKEAIPIANLCNAK